MLRRVTFRHFASHKLRTLSTIGGIALGVAALVALRLVADAATRAFRHSVDRMAGKAVLQIGNGDVGVPEELAAELKAIPGVSVAAPSVQGFLGAEGMEGERIYVLGIDLLADQELREYQSGTSDTQVEDPLVFLAQPDSVALTDEFLARNRLRVGDVMRVHTSSGVAPLTVRASLDVKTGPATVLAGRIAVMDVFAAQRLFGYDRRFSQIDLGVAPGVDVTVVEDAVRARVAGRGVVERPRARGEALEKLLAGTEATFTVAALVAVVVAIYLVFNTMMIAVAERRREIGVLRALGMRRREVLRTIVAEALLLGAIGSAIGIGGGLWLARVSSASFLTNVSTRFFPVEPTPIVLRLAPIVWGVTVGMGAALIAALVPAREAVRSRPIDVLRSSEAPEVPAHYRRAAIAGAALMLLGTVLFLCRDLLPAGALVATSSVGQNGFLIGASFVTPAVLRWIATRGEDSFAIAFGPLAGLAGRNLVARLRRVAITSAALLVALANAIVLASLISTLQRTMNLMLDAEFGRLEIGIASGKGLTPSDVSPLPASLADEIAALPEIEAVDAERWVKIPYSGVLTYIVARDAEIYRIGLRHMVFLEGTEHEAIEAIARGDSVIVSCVFAHRFSKHLGDVVTLPTPGGEARFRVAGVTLDMLDLGLVMVDRSHYRALWRDDTLSFIDPVPRAGADRARVMETIRSRWGDRYGLSLTTFDQIRKENDELLAQSVAGAYPMIAISLVIALAGVVNSLFASVLDRVREIGLLRAIGATRRQVVRAIVLEATILGIAGGAFGALAGSLLGYMTAGALLHDVFGIVAFYRFPTAAVCFALAAAVLLAAGAGYLPGRAAARLEIAQALGYE